MAPWASPLPMGSPSRARSGSRSSMRCTTAACNAETPRTRTITARISTCALYLTSHHLSITLPYSPPYHTRRFERSGKQKACRGLTGQSWVLVRGKVLDICLTYGVFPII
ncbi:hypothetical protein FIBSPDRAFT_939374 [Athelia psychrophila]|uniref:Uncharacterized protein n=1 Tax=Athelia psychrophila TaxID=1759441 RepID=A0A165WL88_9AGAM|nr:hypothetical protein FIBSPDRAFT_939374 [Fibularhizoctonia sp. CBS 109695]